MRNRKLSSRSRRRQAERATRKDKNDIPWKTMRGYYNRYAPGTSYSALTKKHRRTYGKVIYGVM